MTWIIYCLTNKNNNKKYIGQTKRSLECRWTDHVSDARRGRDYAIHRAIREHGKDSFTKEILVQTASQDEANSLETYYISQLKTNNSNIGYNCTPGGQNYNQSEETKNKIRQARLKQPNPRPKGSKHTEEAKAKISQSKLGKTRGPMSDSTKTKLSLANTGQKRSESSRAQMSKSHTGKCLSETHRQNISKSNTGKKMSNDSIQKRTETKLKTKHNCSSKFLGVSWSEGRNKWVAQIQKNGKHIYIGRFNSELEAAKARDQKALELFGPGTILNIKDSQ